MKRLTLLALISIALFTCCLAQTEAYATNEVLVPNGPYDAVGSGLAVSHDGRYIGTSLSRDAFCLRDATTGRVVRVFLTGGSIHYAYFTPDDKAILLSGFGGSGHLPVLYEVATGKAVRTFRGHSHYVSEIDIHPSGKVMVTSSFDHSAILWDMATGAILHRFRSNKDGRVRFSQFIGERQLLVSSWGDYDGTLETWTLPETYFQQSPAPAGQPAAGTTPGPASSPVLAISYKQGDHSNTALVVREKENRLYNLSDKQVQVFNLATGERILCAGRTTLPAETVSWNDKGNELRVVTRERSLWTADLNTGTVERRRKEYTGYGDYLGDLTPAKKSHAYVARNGEKVLVYDEPLDRLFTLNASEKHTLGYYLSPAEDRLATFAKEQYLKPGALPPPTNNSPR